MQNNVNSILIWGTYYHKFGQNINIFKIVCTKYMASSEAMTSSTHSIAYSYRLVKKCFVKICETSKCHNFLIFQQIFIRFSLLCSKFFTLSSLIPRQKCNDKHPLWVRNLRNKMAFKFSLFKRHRFSPRMKIIVAK